MSEEFNQDQPAERKVGRPSKFNERVKEKILELAEEGKTDEEIAEIIGVSRKTIGIWKKTNWELGVALREAKLDADALVEASLFQRAVGYSHKATKFFQHEGCIITEDYVEHYPPDTSAAKFWLNNRQPDRWREKQPGEVDVVVNNITSIPDEKINARIDELVKKHGQ